MTRQFEGFSTNLAENKTQIEFDQCNLYALINNTDDLMWSVDTSYKLITSNRAFDEAMLLMSGKPVKKGDYVLAAGSNSREQVAKFKQYYDWAFAGHTFTEIEYDTNPLEQCSEISFYPIRKDGAVIGTACFAKDITERKIAEAKLKNNEHRFRALIENSADAVAIYSPRGELLYISPSVQTILGYTADELMQMDLAKIVYPDVLATRAQRMEKVMSNPGETIKGFSKQMLHKDGSWRWIESSMTNMLHEPDINGIVDNFRDITERKTAEEKLEHSELRLKQAQEIAHTGSWEMDLTTRIINWSEVTNRIYGHGAGRLSLSFDEWLSYTHPDDLESLLNSIAVTKSTHSDASIYYRIIKKDGAIRYLHLLSHYELDASGEPVSIYGALQDITELKIAEEKLSTSEHRFRSLIEHSSDGIIIVSAGKRPMYVSPSVTNLLGYTPDEFIKLNLVDITHPDDVIPTREAFEKALANPGITMRGYTGRRKHKNGTWRWIEILLTNMLHDPALNGIVNNFRDVTERKLDEEKIIHTNKLYSFISQLNHTIVYSCSEQMLFKEACRIAVEYGDFRVAWIGTVDESKKKFSIVEQFGMHTEDLSRFTDVSYVENGPVDMAIRTGKYYISDFENDPSLEKWQPFAKAQKWRSYTVLPIKRNGIIVATFNLCAEQTEYFTEEKIALLETAAGDISFTLDVFEQERLRIQSEKKLQHNELRFNQAQAIAHIGSWELDFSTGIATWSAEHCRIYGLSKEDNILSYQSWLSMIHPDDRDHVLLVSKEGRESLKEFSFYHRIIRKDGAIRYIYSQNHFEINDAGIPMFLYGASHDVTEMKESVEKLKYSELRLKQAQGIAHIGSWERNFSTGVALWSEEQCNIYGLSPENDKQTYESWLSFVHPDDREQVMKINEAARSTLSNTDFYHRIIRMDGSLRHIHVQAQHEFDIMGNPVGIYGVSHDMTDAKIAEEKIMYSASRLKQAQEIAHLGSWELGFATGVGIWSEEHCKIYGLTPEDNKHTYESWLSFIHPDDLEHVIKVNEADTPTLSNVSFYHRIIRRDGTVRYMHTQALFEINTDGKPVGLYGVAHDITEQQTNIMQIKAQNKQLREIAWIQSHKVRGPVATILGLAQLFQNKEYEVDTEEIIEGILYSSEQLDTVIREIVKKSEELDTFDKPVDSDPLILI